MAQSSLHEANLCFCFFDREGRLQRARRTGPNRTMDKSTLYNLCLFYVLCFVIFEQDVPASWFMIDLGPGRSVIPTFYTLRHGGNYRADSLRNWDFQGSANKRNSVVLIVLCLFSLHNSIILFAVYFCFLQLVRLSR
jgi:hypothetical protein